MDIEGKLEMILEWSEYKDWFDDEFVRSVDEFYSRTGRVSSRQEEAIDKIIDNFNIKKQN